MPTPAPSDPKDARVPPAAANPPLALHQILAEEYVATVDGVVYSEKYKTYLETVQANKPEREKLTAIIEALHETPRLALCFSGGGIRSATFNLGVLQGLAMDGLLRQFHYLSTVSGGGYIGSWLTAWIHQRKGKIAEIEKEIAEAAQRETDVEVHDPAAAAKAEPVDKLHPEPSPIEHLREYSNYLSPKLGFFSADTWTMVGAYLRNLLLNWLVLVPLLAAVLAVPRIGVILASKQQYGEYELYALVGGALFAVGALAFIGTSLPSTNPKRSRRRHQARFLVSCLVPMVLAAVCSTAYWAFHQNAPGLPPITEEERLLYFCGFGMGIHVVAGIWTFCRPEDKTKRDAGEKDEDKKSAGEIFLECFAVVTSGALAGALLWVVAVHVFPYPHQNPAAYACFAAPITLGVLLMSMFFYIGCVGKTKTDEDREWWARASGWVMISCVIWMGASVLVIYGPCVFEITWSGLGLSLTGVASALFSALAGLSAKSAPTEDKKAEEEAKDGFVPILLDNAPVLASLLFAICLAIGISFGTTKLISVVDGALHHPGKEQTADLKAGAPAAGGAAATIPASTSLATPPPAPRVAVNGVSVEVKPAKPPPAAAANCPCLATTLTVPPKGPQEITNGTAINVTIAPAEVEKKNPWLPPGGFKHPSKLKHGLLAVVIVIAALLLFGGAAGWAINANVFSLHAMYRDRLIRAYLGASRVEGAPRRDPNLFTGFDENDNIPMWKLWGQDEAKTRGRMLFPVINCTLNLVGGKNLAWQDRKAESFTVSPLHSGSFRIGKGPKEEVERDNAPATGKDPNLNAEKTPPQSPTPPPPREPDGKLMDETMGYRLNNPSGADDPKRNDRYGGERGITLGTALTISGAAVSPNWGYHSSPLVTLIMTFFNVRLGWWLGNPGKRGDKTFNQWCPTWSPRPVVEEALGWTDDTNRYIYLSDGGHFENLGVYEMILRRCLLIVASDAGQDGEFTFEDLGNLVRKVRVDFGIPIEFVNGSGLFKCDEKTNRPTDNVSRMAVACVRYSAIDKNCPDGLLIYIKPVVYGENEPRDVVQYWKSSPGFPHETTVDQFFSESQFESYRALGLYTVRQIIGRAADPKKTRWSIDEFIAALKSELPDCWNGVEKLVARKKPAEKKGKKSKKAEPPKSE